MLIIKELLWSIDGCVASESSFAQLLLELKQLCRNVQQIRAKRSWEGYLQRQPQQKLPIKIIQNLQTFLNPVFLLRNARFAFYTKILLMLILCYYKILDF